MEIITTTVLEALKSKHPEGKPPSRDAILPVKSNQVTIHPVLFDKIDATLIRNTVLRTTGSASPSDLDAKNWRRMCTSYKMESNDLFYALALMAKQLHRCRKVLEAGGTQEVTVIKWSLM